jgi:GNAT superfamily N-acetyltransferase
MRAPADDPLVSEFMDNLARINAVADATPGFVWRLQTEQGNATDIHAFPDPRQLVNMSVWESVESFKQYVYRSDHVEFFRRRAEWFEADAKRVALWWVAAGTIPELDEAVRRLEFLERHGTSPYAFGVGSRSNSLVIELTQLDDQQTLDLVSRLNAELAALAVESAENHFGLDPGDVVGSNGVMIRARYDGRPVGCGAVRRIEPTVGEIKRMFVDPSVRGLKIGAAILDQLEHHATRLGITELKLETGPRQIEAIALYERVGFERCDLWGSYRATPATSRCYRKLL